MEMNGEYTKGDWEMNTRATWMVVCRGRRLRISRKERDNLQKPPAYENSGA